MPVEVVRLLRLPGDCRALVSEEVAVLGDRMGEMKRLDRLPDPDHPRMKAAPTKLPIELAFLHV